jgi:hypothetical protein
LLRRIPGVCLLSCNLLFHVSEHSQQLKFWYKRSLRILSYPDTVPMSSSSDNCALGPDGKLLPAEEIQWFNDPDDPQPISAPPKSGITACPAPSPNAFDVLLKKGVTPASVVVGSRRSARTSRPSAKLRNAQDGGQQSAAAAGKCKA